MPGQPRAPQAPRVTWFSSLWSAEAALHQSSGWGSQLSLLLPRACTAALCSGAKCQQDNILLGTKALVALNDFKEGFAIVLLV